MLTAVLAVAILGACLGTGIGADRSLMGGSAGSLGILAVHATPFSAGIASGSTRLRVVRSAAPMTMPASSSSMASVLGIILLAVTSGATLRQPFALRLRL
jgi:hypothetical protein